MRSVNKKYLNHDHVTDVLTFDLGIRTGEIIICPQIAGINAKAHQTSTEKEIILYVIHGILHLAGFDDHKPQRHPPNAQDGKERNYYETCRSHSIWFVIWLLPWNFYYIIFGGSGASPSF